MRERNTDGASKRRKQRRGKKEAQQGKRNMKGPSYEKDAGTRKREKKEEKKAVSKQGEEEMSKCKVRSKDQRRENLKCSRNGGATNEE